MTWHTDPPTWPGIIYFDQTGNDAWLQSGTTSFTGKVGPEVISVDVYPQGGTTSAHDMQVNWKTSAETWYDTAKSSPVVNYTLNNGWTRLNFSVNNNKWWGQTVKQLRLDFDAVNHSTRFHINDCVKQSAFWWHFTSDVMGWTPISGVNGLFFYSDPTWAGFYCDQTGNDAYLNGPRIPAGGDWPYYYLGGANDKIRVRVYPQGGTTSNHDMAIYWTVEGDNYIFTEAKSTHVNYTANNQWYDVILPVGLNPNWNRQHITQIRLDFDQVNHGTRWHVDSIGSEY
jgi:hypothetical protein